jgi:heme exporter protein A
MVQASHMAAVADFKAERLSARALACRRGGRMVFEGLSFDVGPGEYLHLAGNNGSGKSSLLRVIAGLIPQAAGEVSYGDTYVEGADLAASGKLLYAGHQQGLKPVWTLRENCDSYCRIVSGAAVAEARLIEASRGFGLENFLDLPVSFFSSGQLHRANLLRFLLVDRAIWLMDEPTVGLDSDNRKKLEVIMQAHLEKGGIIIAASHDPIDVPGETLRLTDFAPAHEGLEYWT